MDCPYCRRKALYVDMYYCCTKCERKFFNSAGYGFEFKNKITGEKL